GRVLALDELAAVGAVLADARVRLHEAGGAVGGLRGGRRRLGRHRRQVDPALDLDVGRLARGLLLGHAGEVEAREEIVEVERPDRQAWHRLPPPSDPAADRTIRDTADAV